MNPKCPYCKKTMITKEFLTDTKSGFKTGLAKFWFCVKCKKKFKKGKDVIYKR